MSRETYSTFIGFLNDLATFMQWYRRLAIPEAAQSTLIVPMALNSEYNTVTPMLLNSETNLIVLVRKKKIAPLLD